MSQNPHSRSQPAQQAQQQPAQQAQQLTSQAQQPTPQTQQQPTPQQLTPQQPTPQQLTPQAQQQPAPQIQQQPAPQAQQPAPQTQQQPAPQQTVTQTQQQPAQQQTLDRGGQQSRPTMSPFTDVFEDPEFITIIADLPGCDPEDIRLEGSETTLRIVANHPDREEDDEIRAVQRERPQRSERVIQLPAAVDFENAEASFENGLCEVKLHKREDEKKRQIGFQ